MYKSVSPSNDVAYVQSSDPCNVVVYNRGTDADNLGTAPFQMNVIPFEMFANSYQVCTPGVLGGRSFPKNYLGVVFATKDAKIPDDLQIGVVTGDHIVWDKLSSMFGNSIGQKDYYAPAMPNGLVYAYKECVLPKDGVYYLRATDPFAVYLYGGSENDSYGHPAGSLCLDLTKSSDKLKPVTDFQSEQNAVRGTFTDLPSNVAIRSNLAKAVLSPNSMNARFTVDRINAKNSPLLNWRLEPINPKWDMSAIVAVSDFAGNDTVFRFILPAGMLAPVISSSAGDTVCVGKSTTLSAGHGYSSYLWSTGDTTETITISSSVARRIDVQLRTTTVDAKTLNSKSDTITFVDNPPAATVMQVANTLLSSIDGTRYQWFLNGSAITGATSKSYALGSVGVYAVEVTNEYGCSTRSDEFRVLTLDREQSDDPKNSFMLHPSPAFNSCRLDYNDFHPTRVELLSIEGATISVFDTQYSDKDHLDIPLHNVSIGCYIVRIYVSNKIHYLQLLKL